MTIRLAELLKLIPAETEERVDETGVVDVWWNIHG
jgi:hypothetical protein